MAEAPNPTTPTPGEKTGAQLPGGLVIGASLPGLGQVAPGTYQTYRDMLRDPSVALAKAVVESPILAAGWSVEADDDAPDQWVALIQDMIVPMRPLLVHDALHGGLVFGWQAWEKVWQVRPWQGRTVQWVGKLKPLLHDITEIVIDRNTGKLVGVKQNDLAIPVDSSLIYTLDREGDNYYGRPRMENVRDVWSWWKEANQGAARYDKKVAGAWIVMHFPPGQSQDNSGTEKPNWQIARDLLNGIVSSGTIAIPNEYAAHVDNLGQAGPEKRRWLVEVLEDKGGRQPQFIERLRYLDSLKFRGFLRPERVATEGQHGTLAESEAQADLSLTEGEQLHQDIVRQVNWHMVDQVLALNFGEAARGKVRIQAAPMQDAKRAIYKQVLAALLQNPTTLIELLSAVDVDAVLDTLDVPKTASVVDLSDTPPDPATGDAGGENATGPGADAVTDLYRKMRASDAQGNR